MKKLMIKIFTIMACMIMISTLAPIANVQAATRSQGTIDLKKKVLTIPNGTKTMIKKNTLTVVKGRRYQVKAQFGNAVVKSKGVWKSSKPAVVTVSMGGLVIANAPGTATVKVTYGGKTQSLKVRVIADHTHSWKTLKKATCAAKGKKLCKVCGATSATAKIKHVYKTDVTESVEGRGKETSIVTVFCNNCNINMTDWTKEERNNHQFNFNIPDCFGSGTHGAVGVTEYSKHVMVRYVETTCKYCGAWNMSRTKDTDLYEVYYDIYANLRRKDNGAVIKECETYTKAKKYFVNNYENINPLQYDPYEFYRKINGFVLCPKCNIDVRSGYTCKICGTIAPGATTAKAADADNINNTVSDDKIEIE